MSISLEHEAPTRGWRGVEPEVNEGFVTASGRVARERLLPREIFWRRHAAQTPGGGKLVVIAPDFGETGRDWGLCIGELTRAGHDVLVFDHQWAGYSVGETGTFDRGFGVARDTAAVLAMAHAQWRRDPHDAPGAEMVVLGAGLGASVGVWLALCLNAAGELHLDGVPMPRGLRAVLCAPFLAPSSASSRWTAALAKVPWVGARWSGEGEHEAALGSTHVANAGPVIQRGQHWRAWRAAQPDLEYGAHVLRASHARGVAPIAVTVLHGLRDPVAGAHASARLQEHGVRIRLLHTDEHALHQRPATLAYVLGAVEGHLSGISSSARASS